MAKQKKPRFKVGSILTGDEKIDKHAVNTGDPVKIHADGTVEVG
jgi:hypothetical protein